MKPKLTLSEVAEDAFGSMGEYMQALVARACDLYGSEQPEEVKRELESED